MVYAPPMTYQRMRQHAQARRYGQESAEPRGDSSRHITPSDVAATRKQSGPVRSWADMTPEERQRIMDELRSSS